MEARAVAKYLQGSPQKSRLVIDTIRGKNVNEALAILRYTNKRAAAPIEKVLRSAIANASYLADERNVTVDVDALYVAQAFVDLGPTKFRRRRRPAPMGRAYSERRWRNHVTIVVSTEKPRAIAEREARQAKGAAASGARSKPSITAADANAKE
jgi:large subunit ribosomal protein L22